MTAIHILLDQRLQFGLEMNGHIDTVSDGLVAVNSMIAGMPTVLSKAITIAAAVFMVTSLSLAILATRNASSAGSVLERQKEPVKTAPATPANKAPDAVTPQPIPLPPPPAQQPAPKK
jgi:preprotein translocase subunit SecG